MKCPNDQTEMEKGRYTDRYWFSGDRPPRFKQSLFGKLWGLTSMNKMAKTEFALDMFSKNRVDLNYVENLKYVDAWRCPKCGKVELYSEVGK